jgi:imidazolonepropionase-like amidohydrolase
MNMKRYLSRWGLLFFSLTLGACAATAPGRPIVIQGAALIDGTGRAAIADSIVVIRDGRFAAVGKRGEVAIPQDAETIDAKGKTLLPGLIDGHCHYRDWMASSISLTAWSPARIFPTIRWNGSSLNAKA